MPPSPFDTTRATNASTSIPALHQAAVSASRARVRTYTAHALVLFNVYGIPLSSGIWLEYYFTSLHPTISLVTLSSVFATQITALGLAAGISAWLHARSSRLWRLMVFTGALLVCGAYVSLLTNTSNRIWVLVLCQGALTGLGLGVLYTTSLQVLSTHYKHSIATASRVCVAAGFLGAIVYTVSAWACLRLDEPRVAYGLTLLLLVLTLLTAILLMAPAIRKIEKIEDVPQTQPIKQQSAPLRKARCIPPLLLASPLILTVLFIPPFHVPLLLAHRPIPYRADVGVYTLLTLYGTALLSSALAPRIPPSRLSPTILCAAASVLAGVATVPVVWMQRLDVAVVCAGFYGVGMGVLGTLWGGLVGEGGGSVGWASVVAVVLGVCAAGGVVGGAALLSGLEIGGQILLGAVAGCLIAGGLVLASTDGMRHWRER